MDVAVDDEKKIGKSSSSMDDDEFKIPLVWAGYYCDLTRELALEERREQKHLHISSIREFRANNPRPRNNNSRVTRTRVPAIVVYSDYLTHATIPPEPRVLPPGLLARAKLLNEDFGVSSGEK